MLVPKLRFKREDGTDYPEWEKDKWSALGDFVASGTLSKADLAETGTPCILYGELYTKYGEIAHMIYSKTSATSHTFSQADDVVLPKSGETPEDISTATCIPYGGISLGGDLIVFRHNEKVIGAYLSYLISNRAKNAIASIAQGKSVVHINEKALSNIELPYPQIEEQQKIADFFSAVDEVIAQSEAEVQNLEQQKKAAMQKIFSQEVRFKREDGTNYSEWSKMKLGSILCEYKETCEKDGTYEHISLTKEGVVPKSERYERDFLVTDDSKKYRVTHLDDICYNPANLKFGVICRNKYGDGIFSPIYVTFKVQGDNLPIFVEMIVTREDFIKYALRFQQGTVYERMAVSPEDLLSITVNVPCLEEQQKIADFLSAYDEAINYAKQELDKWKELKKGLLQQMFV